MAIMHLALLSLALAPQSVHVVDDGGGAGVDFTDLATAVTAALDGDVLLVKAGTYAGFALDGKGLAICAEAGETVRLSAGFSIENVPASSRAIVRGIGVDFLLGDRSRVRNNAGWIGIEDCAFDGLDPLLDVTLNGALAIEASTVVLVRCEIAGGWTQEWPGFETGCGVALDGAELFAYGCTITGAHGYDSGAGAGAGGGPGLLAVDSFLLASGCTLLGGNGGNGGADALGCGDGGDGGPGLASAGSASVHLQDTSTAGGPAGSGGLGCADGARGAAIVGASTPLAGTARSLEVESPVRMGTLAHNVFTGDPGELAILGISLAPDALFFPPWFGAFAIQLPQLTAPVGFIAATGKLEADFAVPLIAGFQALQLYEQAAFLAPSGAITLSAPSYPLVLDAAF